MTKRFTRIICSNDEYTGSLYCNDEPLKIEQVCELLNENEQLKQTIKEAYETESIRIHKKRTTGVIKHE